MIAAIVIAARTSSVTVNIDDGEDTLLVVSENVASSATVLKARRDVLVPAPPVRRQVVFASTAALETTGCVAAFPGDDTCAMGVAAVSSVGSLAGGPGSAAAASYARLGQLLYPPKEPPMGVAMLTSVDEVGVVNRRFVFSNPAGLTPEPGKAPGGFAIVASGAVLDATATARRALFFVDTTTTPWAVKSSLSK